MAKNAQLQKRSQGIKTIKGLNEWIERVSYPMQPASPVDSDGFVLLPEQDIQPPAKDEGFYNFFLSRKTNSADEGKRK